MSDIAQPMYVLLEGTHGRTDPELTMTPRLSRIGLGLDSWQVTDRITGEGKLEVDFAGSSGGSAIRLRHAYASMSLAHTTASPRPMLQWLVEYRHRLRGDVVRLGLWGHVSTSELGDATQYTGASAGMHLYLPITHRMVWLGEAYVGDNLADIDGAIDQDDNAVTRRNIHGAGGWLELAMLATERHMLALGASLDSARTADLAPGDRERNRTIYAALRYQPLASLQLGAEYLYWQTRDKEVGQGVANRFDLHLSVLF
jgi:hypothetical protein